ncbi:unnamed protein product [Cyprideis torosa]|uniref:Uncharacterized protein n=1 Tax=Cyprideis torosa TaxID=163714 RepID=A0A7R8WRN8_9CRUS|nr:unnamed protein product [Cyprideis torosa]CAG0904023.1 unnamed protein product [Cyprideis torosa]
MSLLHPQVPCDSSIRPRFALCDRTCSSTSNLTVMPMSLVIFCVGSFPIQKLSKRDSSNSFRGLSCTSSGSTLFGD